jgi:hypothetical protein
MATYIWYGHIYPLTLPFNVLASSPYLLYPIECIYIQKFETGPFVVELIYEGEMWMFYWSILRSTTGLVWSDLVHYVT